MVLITVKQINGDQGSYIDWEFSNPITENVSVEAKILITSLNKTFQIAGFSSSPPSLNNRIFSVEFGTQPETYHIFISDRYYFKWIAVKINIDFSNNQVAVYINDQQVTTASLENTASQLALIRISVYGGDTTIHGMMFVDNVKVYSTTQTYLDANFEDETLDGGTYDNTRTEIYFIDEPYTFDWNQATIQQLSLSTGPNGTTYFRDPTILHDERGFAIRINDYFYMCPANIASGETIITHNSKATLMRSTNLVDWEIVADLSQYNNLRPNNYYPTRADMMYDSQSGKIYVLVELWDVNDNKYYALYEAPNIDDPSTWILRAGPSQQIYGGVPWLVRNPSTGKLEAWLEYRPGNSSDYTIAKIEIDESAWTFGSAQIVYDVREAGWHTPNPAIVYGTRTLVLTNPVPALGGISKGLYCVISVPIPDTDDIAILKNGTWNNPAQVSRHETPRLVTTQQMLDSGNFWLMWWEGNFGSGAFSIKLMTYGSPSVDNIPNVSGEGGGGGGGGGETPSLGFDCYELARLMMIGEVTKILSGKEPDISKVMGLMIQCKMMEVLMSQLSGS